MRWLSKVLLSQRFKDTVLAISYGHRVKSPHYQEPSRILQREKLKKVSNPASQDGLGDQFVVQDDPSKVVNIPKVERYDVAGTVEGQKDERSVTTQFDANVECHQVTNCAEHIQPQWIDSENAQNVDHFLKILIFRDLLIVFFQKVQELEVEILSSFSQIVSAKIGFWTLHLWRNKSN